ncbi:MAG: hypothetical protein WCT42_04360 [Candidatus Paceibacterota bacterium]|jgi:hypothetical protein
MKQIPHLRIFITLLFLTLAGFMVWWVYDSYFPFNKPTPLSSGTLINDITSKKTGESTATHSAIASPTPTPSVDPEVKKLLPFDSAQLDSGVKFGKITVTTVDVLNIFSSLAYRTSRDLTDKALWQEAATKASQQAIIVDEANKRGFAIPANNVFLPENISSATIFLENALKTENKSVTVDDLIAARSGDVIVLTNTPK